MNEPIRDGLIVAGGRGTRLQPLTYGVPKPLLPFCGQPFLAGLLARLRAVGVERTWLVVGADTAPFAVLDDAVPGMELRVVTEAEPLDTAGGVRSVADQLPGPVLVLNGDVLTDVDFGAVITHHRAQGADATIVLTRVEDTSSFGVCLRDGTRIVDFVEKPAPGTLPGQDTINAGTYVLDPRTLDAFPNGRLSFEHDVFPGILADGGHVEGFVWEGVWMDLGTPDRWLAGTRLALSGALAWPSLDELEDRGDRVLVRDADVHADALVAGPVAIDTAVVGAGATVGPNTWLGSGVHVGASARVSDTVVMEGSVVGAGVTLERVIVGWGSTIHAGATIGPDVVIGHGQHVGADDVLPAGTRRPPRRD